jgi:methylglutaconyl-CoA hydratase
METLIKKIDERGVASIWLNRPEKHHAFDRTMIDEMTAVMAELGADDNVRVAVLASDGPTFCAGGDLNWMHRQAAADREGKIAEATSLAMMLKAIHDLPKLVICRVQGNAFGGGVGLMAAADITIAAESAKFALTETRLGLIPATIGPFIMARIGSATARSVLVNGSTMTAHRAERLGLVSIVAAEDALNEVVEREIQSALKASPNAMARAKFLAIRSAEFRLDAQINEAIAALADCWEDEETQIGIKAFFAKVPPPWAED